jgi:3-methyladenine DNA glycosylase AlkD
MSLIQLKKELRAVATKERAKTNAWFFKSGSGQYGEGDIFIGVTVPDTRKIIKKHTSLSIKDIDVLLKSKIHEERLSAILLLIEKYENATGQQKKDIYTFYLAHATYVNNWDLVDASAAPIVGDYLQLRNRKILEKLARSKNLWEKRIAIVATFAFIKEGEYEWTFKISSLLLTDTHDLIHKACGWMLREVGKRVSEEKLCEFLDLYASHMPRTMLRYAIERFSPAKRKQYLNM